MANIFSDNFNRANEATLGQPYITASGAGLILENNQVKGGVAKSVVYIDPAQITFSANHHAEIEITALMGFDAGGVACRVSTGNGYCLVTDGTTGSLACRIYKVIANTWYLLGSYTSGFVVGDKLKLAAYGTTLTAQKNGAQIIRLTGETDHASGQPGMAYDKQNSAGTKLDNFYASDAPGKIFINLAASGINIPGFNNFSAATTVGQLSANLVDEYGQNTGRSLTLDAAFTGSAGNSTYATEGTYGFPKDFYCYTWWDGTNLGQLSLSATNGEPFSISIAGHGGAAGNTDITVTGATSNPTRYVRSANTIPSPPVIIGGRVANNSVRLNFAKVTDYSRINGFSIEFSSPTVNNLINGTNDTLAFNEQPGSVPFGGLIDGISDTLTFNEQPGTVAFGGRVDGISDTLTFNEQPGTIAFGGLIDGTSDTLTFNEQPGTVAFGGRIDGTSDTLTFNEQPGSVPFGGRVDGISDTLTFNEQPGVVPFGTVIDGISDVLTYNETQGIVAYGNRIDGTSDALTFSETQGIVAYGNRIDGTSDALTFSETQGIVAFGGHVDGISDTLAYSETLGIIADRGIVAGKADTLTFTTTLGEVGRASTYSQEFISMRKLYLLRQHLLSLPDEMPIDGDRLVIFVDQGTVVSAADGTNLHFEYQYKANVIIENFSGNPHQLFFWILTWMAAKQPGHKPEAIHFDTDIINDKTADVAITMDLTETVHVEQTINGITLVSQDDPDMRPVLLTSNRWQILRNNAALIEWQNNG